MKKILIHIAFFSVDSLNGQNEHEPTSVSVCIINHKSCNKTIKYLSIITFLQSVVEKNLINETILLKSVEHCIVDKIPSNIIKTKQPELNSRKTSIKGNKI